MYDPYMLQQNPYNRYASVSPANAPISQFQNGGQIVRVNGYQGAQAYQMGANAAAVLFDANEDIFYKKITDGAGFASIEIYSYAPAQKTTCGQGTMPVGDYVTRSEFEELKGMVLNGKHIPKSSDTERK